MRKLILMCVLVSLAVGCKKGESKEKSKASQAKASMATPKNAMKQDHAPPMKSAKVVAKKAVVPPAMANNVMAKKAKVLVAKPVKTPKKTVKPAVSESLKLAYDASKVPSYTLLGRFFHAVHKTKGKVLSMRSFSQKQIGLDADSDAFVNNVDSKGRLRVLPVLYKNSLKAVLLGFIPKGWRYCSESAFRSVYVVTEGEKDLGGDNGPEPILVFRELKDAEDIFNNASAKVTVPPHHSATNALLVTYTFNHKKADCGVPKRERWSGKGTRTAVLMFTEKKAKIFTVYPNFPKLKQGREQASRVSTIAWVPMKASPKRYYLTVVTNKRSEERSKDPKEKPFVSCSRVVTVVATGAAKEWKLYKTKELAALKKTEPGLSTLPIPFADKEDAACDGKALMKK